MSLDSLKSTKKLALAQRTGRDILRTVWVMMTRLPFTVPAVFLLYNLESALASARGDLHLRRELVSWEEVQRLIDHLTQQFEHEFHSMLVITRGGIIPGGMLAERMGLRDILTAAVNFPATLESRVENMLVWPQFLQFPEEELLRAKRILVVDDVWGSGRTSTAVKTRVSASGGMPFTSVLHFNPHRNLFGSARPDYFAASTDAYIVYPWEQEPTAGWARRDY